MEGTAAIEGEVIPVEEDPTIFTNSSTANSGNGTLSPGLYSSTSLESMGSCKNGILPEISGLRGNVMERELNRADLCFTHRKWSIFKGIRLPPAPFLKAKTFYSRRTTDIVEQEGISSFSTLNLNGSLGAKELHVVKSSSSLRGKGSSVCQSTLLKDIMVKNCKNKAQGPSSETKEIFYTDKSSNFATKMYAKGKRSLIEAENSQKREKGNLATNWKERIHSPKKAVAKTKKKLRLQSIAKGKSYLVHLPSMARKCIHTREQLLKENAVARSTPSSECSILSTPSRGSQELFQDIQPSLYFDYYNSLPEKEKEFSYPDALEGIGSKQDSALPMLGKESSDNQERKKSSVNKEFESRVMEIAWLQAGTGIMDEIKALPKNKRAKQGKKKKMKIEYQK